MRRAKIDPGVGPPLYLMITCKACGSTNLKTNVADGMHCADCGGFSLSFTEDKRQKQQEENNG